MWFCSIYHIIMLNPRPGNRIARPTKLNPHPKKPVKLTLRTSRCWIALHKPTKINEELKRGSSSFEASWARKKQTRLHDVGTQRCLVVVFLRDEILLYPCLTAGMMTHRLKNRNRNAFFTSESSGFFLNATFRQGSASKLDLMALMYDQTRRSDRVSSFNQWDGGKFQFQPVVWVGMAFVGLLKLIFG